MKLSDRLFSLRLYDALAEAGIIKDPATVNRVVIDAPRGGLVVVHVELITDTRVLRVAPLLDGLPLGAEADQDKDEEGPGDDGPVG